jgi:hypothetical protein
VRCEKEITLLVITFCRKTANKESDPASYAKYFNLNTNSKDAFVRDDAEVIS